MLISPGFVTFIIITSLIVMAYVYSQLVPVALLLMNIEFLTSPFVPCQKIAPPLRWAVLFLKVTFSTVPSCAPSYQSIAPPFVPATLSSKLEFTTVVLTQSSVLLPCKNIAPPRFLA